MTSGRDATFGLEQLEFEMIASGKKVEPPKAEVQLCGLGGCGGRGRLCSDSHLGANSNRLVSVAILFPRDQTHSAAFLANLPSTVVPLCAASRILHREFCAASRHRSRCRCRSSRQRRLVPSSMRLHRSAGTFCVGNQRTWMLTSELPVCMFYRLYCFGMMAQCPLELAF